MGLVSLELLLVTDVPPDLVFVQTDGTYAIPPCPETPPSVTDNDRGESSTEKVGNSLASIIVIDSSWGPVHAVGQAPVPQNGLVEDPNRSAVAKLQFDAEHPQGGTTASGSLRFQVEGTTFEYQSRRLDWLMVDRSKAEVKGQRTVRGQEDFIFRLGAIPKSGEGDKVDD